jgi:phospholipase D1/2
MDAATARDMTARPDDGRALPDLRVMLTAQEAYPYLESLFLQAQDRIAFSFRVFDPDTPLLSPEARRTGDTWAELVMHTLDRGVSVRGVISDFDPVGAPELHRATHRSLRRLAAAAAARGCEARLDIAAHMHPARAGWPFRLLFAPLARHRLAAIARRCAAQGPETCAALLADMPGLAPYLRARGEETGPRSVPPQPRPGALPMLHPCSHHQKIAVADGRRASIGGLDLDRRRLDSPEHDKAAKRTWHDVQIGLTGAVAAAAEAHLAAFRSEVAGRTPPAARPGLLRTLSARRNGLAALALGPRPLLTDIFARTVQGARGADRLIYLETQFLRDLRLARVLAARARAAPGLGMILVLPAAPEDAAFSGDTGFAIRFGEHLQARCLGVLRRAFGPRLTVIAPAQPRGVAPDGSRAVLCGAPIVYVHAKVSVFDDTCAIVSSANLNARSHRWDTEAGVALEDPAQVGALRRRLMAHWLPEDAASAFFEPDRAPRAWQALAETNSRTAPGHRRGFLLPFPETWTRRFGRPLPLMPHEMV